MKCEYCGAEMDLTENMYMCNECFTTYIVKNDAVVKKYIVSDEFAEEYRRNKSVIVSNNSERKFEVVQRLLQIYSNSPALWNVFGVLHRERNQVEDALRCYEKALNLNPDYIQVLVNVAISYFKLGQLEKANQKMEIAHAKMEPTAPNYEVMLGSYAMIVGKLGDMERAAVLLNEAEARGYKNAAVVRRELGFETEIKSSGTKGFFARLRENAQQAREDAAVKRAYQEEVEKRKSHVRRVRHERELTLQEQQVIDMIEMERNAKIAQWSREGVGFFEAAFTRAIPYDTKIEEIRNRAVWYEDVVIPPQIDPSVPIVIDEEAIRRSVRR